MPELQQYEVNVFPNCKESLYVTAEFPPYCRSNSVKAASSQPQTAVNQVASKPIFPHQLIPLPLKPSKPLNHKLGLSSSGQSTPVTNVASKPIVNAESPRVTSSKKHKQRRIYSNLSDLKLSPSTASSSSPLFEYRNGIQYELAPVEYIDKTVTPPPSDSPSPTSSGPTLSGPKKSFVTQVASKPIHPAQLCPRPLSTPPIINGVPAVGPHAQLGPISGTIFNPSLAATDASLPISALPGNLLCTGRALSTPPPILPSTAGVRELFGVGGLPLRPAVGISPFIGRTFNFGSSALSGVPLGLSLNGGCRTPLMGPISSNLSPPIGLLSRAIGPAACSPAISTPLARPLAIAPPPLEARAPLPIVPLPQPRCAVGAAPSQPSCAPPCPPPCRPQCAPLPCGPPALPCPPNNNLIFGGLGQLNRSDRNCHQSECRTTVKLGKLCGCGKRAKVFLGPPVLPAPPCRRFC